MEGDRCAPEIAIWHGLQSIGGVRLCENLLCAGDFCALETDMKKTALLYSMLFSMLFSVTATLVSASALADSRYKSIRLFENSNQFNSAVENDKVVVGIPGDLILSRTKSEALASKRIETITQIRNADGISRDLVVSCQIQAPAKKLKMKLVSTSGVSNPWHVQSVKRISNSKETWTLGREGSILIQLTCHSFILSGDRTMSEVSLSPGMVHRALGEIGGSVLTSVVDPALYLNSQDYNVGLSGPTGVGSAASNTAQ